ncbi:MAG: acyltransferase family protein [Clostridia bacterium]|nr:acyltransferase family protein [Clostridia bacterium]
MPPKSRRIPGYDLLRVLATFAVILLHTATSQLYAVEVNSSPWQGMIFWDGLMRWSVPAFFLLSGALFLSSDKPFSEILRKNALRIGTAYVFWSFVYALVSRPDGWKGFLYTWIAGHYHLWFCWAILGLYLLVPLLRPLARNETLGRYYLLLAFVFASLLPMLLGLVWPFSPRLHALGAAVIDKINIGLPMGYAGIFVFGYFLAKGLSPKNERLLYLLGILGVLFTPVSALILSVKFEREMTSFYPFLMPNTVFPAAALFVFLKNKVKRGTPLLRLLSDASFGAYLVHVLILGLLSRIGLSSLLFSSWFSILPVAVLAAILSFAVGITLRRIPAIGKYLS